MRGKVRNCFIVRNYLSVASKSFNFIQIVSFKSSDLTSIVCLGIGNRRNGMEFRTTDIEFVRASMPEERERDREFEL